VVIQNIKNLIYTSAKNVNFSVVTQQCRRQGNYMFIPLFGKETQLLLWTGSRAACVKNNPTAWTEKLYIYIYEIKFYNMQLLQYPNCFIRRKYYLTQKSFILNTGTLIHL